MTDDAIATFNAHATEYDAARCRLIPGFDRFYGAAIDALSLAAGPITTVLDLGAGTGMLSSMIQIAHPDARFTLLDGAPDMLAQHRLGDRAKTVLADLTRPLPSGPFDAVVSALAIHHLPDDAKRDLYARAIEPLRPGGVFVNAEQVAAPNPDLDHEYSHWHESQSRSQGATHEEWAGAVQRMTHDLWAPLDDQLQWLRDAGFTDVQTLLEDHRFAVFAGIRPPAS